MACPPHFPWMPRGRYILGYHFTEGTAGDASAPEGIYSVDFSFAVRLPQRRCGRRPVHPCRLAARACLALPSTHAASLRVRASLTDALGLLLRSGRVVLQWLVDAEDVRSYVSCTSVDIVGDSIGSVGDSIGSVGASIDDNEKYDDRRFTCNGHPLCNCTTTATPRYGGVGLGLTCPQGTAPSVAHGSTTGTDIVKQYKEQLGVDAFCGLCISNGCPSTCGGKYKGFYQGPRCTNKPVVGGCGDVHHTALPKYIECTAGECTSSGWSPSPPSPPTPPKPPAPPKPTPPSPPSPPSPRTYCVGNACATGWVYKDDTYVACPPHFPWWPRGMSSSLPLDATWQVPRFDPVRPLLELGQPLQVLCAVARWIRCSRSHVVRTAAAKAAKYPPLDARPGA